MSCAFSHQLASIEILRQGAGDSAAHLGFWCFFEPFPEEVGFAQDALKVENHMLNCEPLEEARSEYMYVYVCIYILCIYIYVYIM